MLRLSGLAPGAVRSSPAGLRLDWSLDGRHEETDFDRFRPIRLVPGEGARALRAVWRDFGQLPMTDGFFRGTLEKAAALPDGAALFQTDLQVLDDLAAQPDNLPFSGVIFHMARTGSTLIHRLFSKTGRVMSLSEVAVLDRCLYLTSTWPARERNAVLRGIVGAFARPRRPGERHLIFKMTDAMPNTRVRQFRDAFPQVPWIFVYRDPVEVMVSMLRGPTGNITNWYKNRAQVAERLGIPAVANAAMWPEEFMARTLRRFCKSAAAAARATPPGLFLAVDYARLPDAIWERIAPHFGIALSDRDIEVMRAEARYSAKRGESAEFRPDSDAKHQEATPRVRALAARFVEPAIEELRALPQA